jgi:hypothetical protein
MSDLRDYPAWICSDCGQQSGSRIPTCATYHMGECGWCGSAPQPQTHSTQNSRVGREAWLWLT